MACLALVASIALQAVITALLGLSLTPADSLLLLVIAATACTLLGALAGRGNRTTSVARAPDRRTLVWLNVWTAVSFVAFYLGVAVHSAAVVFTLEASFAPLTVVACSAVRAHRGGSEARPGSAQCRAACLLAALGTALVVVLAQSDSVEMIPLLVAAALGVIAGVAAGGVATVCRDLGRNGIGVGQVMAQRFYATWFLATTALLTLVPSGLLAPPALHVGLVGVAALAAVVVPLFLLQHAMQRLAPVSVTAALGTMPAITIGVELASGRAISFAALLLALLIVPASLALLVTPQVRKRTSSRPSMPSKRVSVANTPAAGGTCVYAHATAQLVGAA
jgi:hypothetical protein